MKIVIIGGSAAGMKAACRARRLMPDAEITVVNSGEYISYAACGLPYLLSGDIQTFDDLRKTPYDMIKDPFYFDSVKGIEIKTGVNADLIDRATKTVACTKTDSGEKLTLKYDKLVLATGANPVKAPIPGSDQSRVSAFTTAEDAIAMKKACASGQVGSVAVIGGGYIGIELCEAFAALWGIEVTLFEAESSILSRMLDEEIARIAENYLIEEEGITIITDTACTKIEETGEGCVVHTEKGPYDAVFDRVLICLGVKPNISLAESAGLETGECGGIRVNELLQTSDPDIYAGGDCIELIHKLTGKPVVLPLGSLANRTGRIIAENLAGNVKEFAPVLGSTVLKAFEYNIAAVGLNKRTAQAAGYDVCESWGPFDDNAHYYPGDKKVFMKMLFDRNSKRVLGVQAVGTGDVSHRIDSAAAMLRFNADLDSIQDFEHTYAPPFSNPLDPIHFLGFIAESSLRDGVEGLPPQWLSNGFEKDVLILDTRNESERENYPLPETVENEIHIPLEKLRTECERIPLDKKIVAICMKGPRSYEAVRILQSRGYNEVKFLSGGMLFASVCKNR